MDTNNLMDLFAVHVTEGFDPKNLITEYGDTMKQNVLWRADAHTYNEDSYDVKIYLVACEIISYTPCGVWVSGSGYGNRGKRFVNLRNEGGRKWAYQTKDEAIRAVYYRKRRQLQIIEYQQQIANNAIALIKHMGYIK